MKKTIDLALVTADQKAQPRIALSPEVIGQYVEAMDSGDTFPPLVVFQNDAGAWLADGFHRYYAALTAKRATFVCDVHDGGLREAILYSCGANATHGIARTVEDKRRAVETLLADEVWAKWSSREIARQCRVTHPFVERCRKDMDTGNVSSMERRQFVHHKTGEPTLMRPREPKHPSRPELEPHRIASLLHEIERHIDVLGDPADVVARFPDEQWYSFSIEKLTDMAGFLTQVALEWEKRARARANAAR